MTQFNKIAGSSDPNAVASTGEFKGQRFPNSRQRIRAKWSYTKHRWMLAGCTKNSKKLNEIVTRCKLKYEKGDPNFGTYIKEADVFDQEDAFFTHNKLKMMAREGEFVLDKSVAKDMILIMCIQADHQYALNGENVNGITSNRVKYLITDANLDSEAKVAARAVEIEAISLYDALDDPKKIKIAMAMGYISRETDDMELVNEMLWNAAKNDKNRASNGMTVRDYFISMCNTTTDEINVRYLIQKARGEGHLKKVKDQGWLLFGQSVGMSDANIYAYFKNPENQEMILRLEGLMDQDNTRPSTLSGRKERSENFLGFGEPPQDTPVTKVPIETKKEPLEDGPGPEVTGDKKPTAENTADVDRDKDEE